MTFSIARARIESLKNSTFYAGKAIFKKEWRQSSKNYQSELKISKLSNCLLLNFVFRNLIKSISCKET